MLYAVGLAPCAHHPGIVAGDYDHKINAFVFYLVQVLNVPRKVADRTARCEGPRDGKKHDLLVCELFTSMVCLCAGFGVRIASSRRKWELQDRVREVRKSSLPLKYVCNSLLMPDWVDRLGDVRTRNAA